MEKIKRRNIFQEAKQRKQEGMGYRANRMKWIWHNKKCGWNNLHIEYGIRWSDRWQIFPIWNVSNNSQRALMFGIWKLHFTIVYCREKSFDQRSRFLMSKLRKFYQLVD